MLDKITGFVIPKIVKVMKDWGTKKLFHWRRVKRRQLNIMHDSELTPPAVNNTVETTGENWMGSED